MTVAQLVRLCFQFDLPVASLMVGSEFKVSAVSPVRTPSPLISLGKNFGFMELPVRLRPKHDITKGLLTAVRKQKSYGPIPR